MSLLNDSLTAQLAELLKKMVFPVQITAHTDSSRTSGQVRELLTEIAAQSGKITVTEAGADGGRVPRFTIRRAQTDAEAGAERGVGEAVFAGLPLGHEFSSLVLAILQVSGHAPKITAETRKAIEALGEHEITTYMSVSCLNCPEVVQALNTVAILNPKVRHTAVEGSAFREETEKLGVMSVPAVFENGTLLMSGRAETDEIIRILAAGENGGTAAPKTGINAEKMNAQPPYDVLLIGGGPAASAAAIYTARKGLRTAMVMQRRGGQITETESIENHISQIRTTGPQLAADLGAHLAQYDIDIFAPETAQSLQPADSPYGLHTVRTEGGGTLRARCVIVACGATWRTLKVPGENEYRNKGVSFCPHCDGPLFKDKDVTVVGGGNSGVEAAIDLAGIARRVTVIEFADSLKADRILLNTLHSLPNTSVITNAQVNRIEGNGKKVTSVHYLDRADTDAPAREHTLDTDGVFIQIGLLPNTQWLKDTLRLNGAGEIVTDRSGHTSVAGIFAAGDCSDEPYKQIVTAYGSGANAALSAFDYLIRDPNHA